MASSLGQESTNNALEVDQQSDYDNRPTGRVNIVRYVQIDAGAVPSDITIYEVPSGKTLWVNKITGTNSHTFRVLNLYDSIGDQYVGASMIIGALTSFYDLYISYQDLSSPVAFQEGITVPSANMTANQTYILQIEGTLV